ncbi:MAG: hypothetical protein HZC28_05190 [Spirochaetes bacterium]|nr:hypothetical protein [Spirochaetota bacterium]
MNKIRKSFTVVILLFCGVFLPLSAWDYTGHRIVNRLALAGLPQGFPSFVAAPDASERILFLGGEPDRFRNSPEYTFLHVANTDHYFDIEYLPLHGLDPVKISPFRYDFAVAFAAARTSHPGAIPGLDKQRNRDHTREWPGFLPWAITENYARLSSAFSYLAAYRRYGTPTEIANAEASVIYYMGVLGHYAGDAAQPLHTTKHFNGWTGDNPKAYTTARSFHQLIDGGYIEKSDITAEKMLPRALTARIYSTNVDSEGRPGIFSEAMRFIEHNNDLVEPLYALEKTGAFTNAGNTGAKEFIDARLYAAGEFLSSLWRTAYETAPPDTYLLKHLEQRKTAAGK